MKKILTILFMASAIGASATTLNWSANTSNSKLMGLDASTSLTTAQTKAMLVFFFDYSNYDTIINLGKVDSSAVESYAVVKATGNQSDNASAAGRITQSTTTTAYTDSGKSFFARAYTSIDDKTYFVDIFGGAGNGGVWTTEKSGDESIQEKMSWSNGTYGGSTSTTVGTKNAWVAVPEPSVALMGLLGLSMLLKRRRA